MRLATSALALAAALVLPATADAATWEIDPAHTHVGFKVRHMMVTWVSGDFSGVSGTVDYDPESPGDMKVDVSVDMSTVDTGNEKRDTHLVSADFFDVESHPTMTFTSKRVVAQDDGSLDLVGDLTLRGVTKELTLEVTDMTPQIVDPWGNLRVGASATGALDRQEFGVSWNKALDEGGYLVGDQVNILVDVQLTRTPDETAQK